MSAFKGREISEQLTVTEYTMLLSLLRREAHAHPAYRPGMEYRDMPVQLRKLGRLHVKLWAQRERKRDRPVRMTGLGRDGTVAVERV